MLFFGFFVTGFARNLINLHVIIVVYIVLYNEGEGRGLAIGSRQVREVGGQ